MAVELRRQAASSLLELSQAAMDLAKLILGDDPADYDDPLAGRRATRIPFFDQGLGTATEIDDPGDVDPFPPNFDPEVEDDDLDDDDPGEDYEDEDADDLKEMEF